MKPDDPANQRCARCGALFRCGQQSGDADCWCASLPRLPLDRLAAGRSCLCPECLRAETQRAGAG
ncbi:cysteine-rich CWC family protein [Caballeronia sp.]|uniref:cysteine-rich CWC family protein n=1 Tax=Caballeronia sp. TaxID=1931223 RepID=UPI003C4FFB8D